MVENTLRLVRAEAEAKTLRSQAGLNDDLLGGSPGMLRLREQIARAAKANATVVIRDAVKGS